MAFLYSILRVILTVQVVIVQHVVFTTASCQQDGPCKCSLENGDMIDLSELGLQNGSALINDRVASDGYNYSFNPCYPFSEGTICESVAGCQNDVNNDVQYNIGDAGNPQLMYDGEKLIGTYSHTDTLGVHRASTVDYICDPNADIPVTSADGEQSEASYKFTIRSKHCCAAVTPTPTPTPTSPPKPSCTTDYQDFIKTCYISYDGHPEPIKLLIIHDWNGICNFPADLDVALHLYSTKSTCPGVNNRCHPDQPFSVNDDVCKEP